MDVELNITLLFITMISVGIYLITTIFLHEFHKKRNDKTPNLFIINLMIFRYIKRYRQITKAETRHVGPLFYFWIISINIMFGSLILLLLINIVVMGSA